MIERLIEKKYTQNEKIEWGVDTMLNYNCSLQTLINALRLCHAHSNSPFDPLINFVRFRFNFPHEIRKPLMRSGQR